MHRPDAGDRPRPGRSRGQGHGADDGDREPGADAPVCPCRLDARPGQAGGDQRHRDRVQAVDDRSLTPAPASAPMTANTAIHDHARAAISAGRSRDLPLTPAVARLRTATSRRS